MTKIERNLMLLERVEIIQSVEVEAITVAEYEFLMMQRRALLMQVAAIEKRVGIAPKCRSCASPLDKLENS